MTTLSDSDVRKLLEPQALIEALEKAFAQRFPHLLMPARTHINTRDGVFLLMPCYDRSGNTLGLKLVTVQSRPVKAEDRVQATYLLLDPATGVPALVAQAKHLTDLRTAATSAMATKFLAIKNARVLGIFGTGRQARAHLQLLPLVRRFERVLVCGRDPASSEKFVAENKPQTACAIEAADAATCATADVICTCTSSATPVFDGRLLRPGTHINAVGAFQPHCRELDSFTIRRARVVVDSYEGALAEAGDLLIPMRERVVGRDHITCDLHELLSGKKPGRQDATEIALFKSVGCALEDLVAAELIQQKLAGSTAGQAERSGTALPQQSGNAE